MKAQKLQGPAYPTQMITFSDHLRKARLDRGLTQPEVAKLLNVTRDTVFKWEANKCEPSPKFSKSIIAFLGYCPFLGDNLGMQLTRARLISGLTIKEASKVIGCTEWTLSLFELEWFKAKAGTQKKVQAFVDQVLNKSPNNLNGNMKT